MPIAHTVQQGEYLSSIAKKYGFSDWQTIYNHPENADLKKVRPNPDVLCAGDVVVIPDKGVKQEACDHEKQHKFVVKVPKALLKIVVKDPDGKPLANQPYTLTVAWLTVKGTTDGSGLLQQKIPIGIEFGELSLDKLGLSWPINIGHLDPVETPTGIQARLKNLGYNVGEVDGLIGPKTTEALKSFQSAALGQKDPSGVADKDTRDALVKEHGC